MAMSVAALIRALHAGGIQPTGLEIAEALWLAQHLASARAGTEARPQQTVTTTATRLSRTCSDALPG